jgi:uncharacterized membrane protein
MEVRSMRAFASIFAALILMTAGITTAAILGSVAGVVLAVMVGTLILSYAVRHEARSRYVYRRAPDTGRGQGR